MIGSRPARVIAAIIAFAYVSIQGFQFYVFSTLPPTNSPTEAFLQGALSINLWRATLLLLSFWGLMYVFLIVCVQNLNRNFSAMVFAFLGFFIFCLLEVCLRSIELFHFQIGLPAVYKQNVSVAEQKAIIESFSNFQSIQRALYFPLMLSQMIGSIILAITFKRSLLNYLIIFAFALNGLRLMARIFAMFLHIGWLDNLLHISYLPFVLVIFGLIGIWLLSIKDEQQHGHEERAFKKRLKVVSSRN